MLTSLAQRKSTSIARHASSNVFDFVISDKFNDTTREKRGRFALN
jgi:hypothetical protein